MFATFPVFFGSDNLEAGSLFRFHMIRDKTRVAIGYTLFVCSILSLFLNSLLLLGSGGVDG